MSSPTAAQPLAGVRVVALEQAVAAPFATRQLADLGARVIKIERPGGGDFARRYDAAVHGLSSYFVWLNRGKESLTLDVKQPRGRAVLGQLLAGADVFVHNLGPGAVPRLGFAADALAELNPRLVSCAITGYGSDGSWADRKAYDLLIQCQTGLVSVNGTPEGPARVGISVADIAAGMYAYSGVLAALLARASTGLGQAIEVSLFDALAEWMSQPAYYTRYTGVELPRIGTHHPTIAPYGSYRAKDGREVLFSIQNDADWPVFCAGFLGDAAIADDPRFATSAARVAHREELDGLIAAAFERAPSEEIVARFDRLGIANAPVNTVLDFLDHPLLAERSRWRPASTEYGPFEFLAPPVTFGSRPVGAGARSDGPAAEPGPTAAGPSRGSGADPADRDGGAAGPGATAGGSTSARVPAVGEHTDAILAELGFDAAEMRAEGIV